MVVALEVQEQRLEIITLVMQVFLAAEVVVLVPIVGIIQLPHLKIPGLVQDLLEAAAAGEVAHLHIKMVVIEPEVEEVQRVQVQVGEAHQLQVQTVVQVLVHKAVAVEEQPRQMET